MNCIYIHAPVYEGRCLKARYYADYANDRIREIGLRVVSEAPVCIPAENIGDDHNHVAPDKKVDYTGILYTMLRPYLQ